ncbi:hypothetical protein [Streptosporangium saharense]|uniref:hypothetical protein n=1 Tax=Streptosporangium saharense TaxID=1706840 RepID=UPI003441BDD3
MSGVRAEDSGVGVFQTMQWTSWSLGLAVLVAVRHRAESDGVSSAFAGASAIALLNTLVLARRTACEAPDVSAGGGG